MLSAGIARADFNVNLEEVFSGNTPDGSPAWLNVAFATEANAATFCAGSTNGCVKLTLTAVNLSASEKVSEWDFNYGGSTSFTRFQLYDSSGGFLTSDAGSKSLSGIGTFNNFSLDTYQADGDGKFDLGFNFSTAGSGYFNASTSPKVFYLSGLNGAITADGFNSTSATGGDSGSGYISAAHIQGITGGCSGWVGDVGGTTSGGSGPCTAVPEPVHSGLFLTGSLMIGIALLSGRRFFVRP